MLKALSVVHVSSCSTDLEIASFSSTTLLSSRVLIWSSIKTAYRGVIILCCCHVYLLVTTTSIRCTFVNCASVICNFRYYFVALYDSRGRFVSQFVIFINIFYPSWGFRSFGYSLFQVYSHSLSNRCYGETKS